MHALPRRTGGALIDRLRAAVESEAITLLTSARADTLYVDGTRRVQGIGVARGDGVHERIGCRALVLACNGYGGNRALVRRHLPAFAHAPWFGHDGNQGDAVLWGEALGAGLLHMSGHQGHGSVAVPHGILITWATITEGGFQVNAAGERFSNEAKGYSEQGAIVLAEPGGVAWTIFDTRIASIARQFEDFRNAQAAGAILFADTIEALATRTGLPVEGLGRTLTEVASMTAAGDTDRFGRCFAGVAPLAPPYAAVKVTGALFHTQGGLAIDRTTRVLAADGAALPNLFAAGGAAVGVSGPQASGYLSGNGLLTAVGLGFVAGTAAARLASP
jgi:fumarate reductase flavoprotein subunit